MVINPDWMIFDWGLPLIRSILQKENTMQISFNAYLYIKLVKMYACQKQA